MALDAGVDEITVTISLSEIYNQRNVHMSTEQSATAIAEICERAGDTPVDAVLSCSFGSPYEGEIAPSAVASLAGRLRDAGCSAITCADTTGMATPRGITEVVETHLHNDYVSGALELRAATGASSSRSRPTKASATGGAWASTDPCAWAPPT